MPRMRTTCESRMREICQSGLTRGGAVAVIDLRVSHPAPPSYSTVIRWPPFLPSSFGKTMRSGGFAALVGSDSPQRRGLPPAPHRRSAGGKPPLLGLLVAPHRNFRPGHLRTNDHGLSSLDPLDDDQGASRAV